MKRESLDMFATPDALEGEQNLVGFDEEYPDDDDEEEDNKEGVLRPAGWSDYQSTWLDAVDGDLSVGEGELQPNLNEKLLWDHLILFTDLALNARQDCN